MMSGRAVTIRDLESCCEHPQFHGPLPPLERHHHRRHGEHCQHSHDHLSGAVTAPAHGPARPRQYRALLISLGISLAMMFLEMVAGLLTGSLMLVSDAIHMLSHVLALGIGLLALRLASRPCGEHLPFGLYRLEVLGALLNGLSLLGLSLWIIYEGFARLMRPVAIDGRELLVIAILGLVVNLASLIVMHRAGIEDLNTRGTWYHLLADAISSLLVVIGAMVYLQTGWTMIDPLLSLLVAVLVAKWAVGLLGEAGVILLERKPDHIDLAELGTRLHAEFPEIVQIHDLHIWEITSHYICFSAHIVITDRRLSETHHLRTAIASRLRQSFGIGHAVIQFESQGS